MSKPVLNDLDFQGNSKILNLPDPTDPQDAASKQYVDDQLGGGVTGPGSSTDHAIARWVGAGGDEIEDSLVLIDDSGNITLADGTTITIDNGASEGVILSDSGLSAYSQPLLLTSSSTIELGLSASYMQIPAASHLKTDSIQETTAAAGVTIDGVLLKDGLVEGLDIGAITATVAEINYVDGVTSAIQTQIDGKQPLDSDLTTIAGLSPSNNDFMVRNAGAWANRTPAQAIAHLGLDADLATFALPASTTISAFGATLVDDADASAARTTLGLVIGTNVQAYDADLATIAGLTATTDNFIVAVSSAWASRTPAQVKTTLALNNVDNTSDATKNSAVATLQNKTFDDTSPTAFFYPGFLMHSARPLTSVAPTGWLVCDGGAVSRSTYAALFAAIVPDLGTFTVTIASPNVVTKSNHGLVTGDAVYLTTTGALPTGLSANTLYYVLRVDANTFNLCSTRANAHAGTRINTTGSQSGTHTLRACPFGLGNGSTTFNVPDFRGEVLAGADAIGGTAAGRLTNLTQGGAYGQIGAHGGEQSHQLTIAELAAHTHGTSSDRGNINWSGGSSVGQDSTVGLARLSASTGGDAAHNTVQATGVVNIYIKT